MAQHYTTLCKGCGTEFIDCPEPERCYKCPAVRCSDCGMLDSSTDPCSCWISLEDKQLPELKYLMALGDMSVDRPVSLD